MNRRDFMQRMFGFTVTIAVNPSIIIPDNAFRFFTGDGDDLGRTAYGKLREFGLEGIPYHLNDAIAGQWLGLPRNSLGPLTATLHAEQHQEYVKLIRKMLDSVMKEFASQLDKKLLE